MTVQTEAVVPQADPAAPPAQAQPAATPPTPATTPPVADPAASGQPRNQDGTFTTAPAQPAPQQQPPVQQAAPVQQPPAQPAAPADTTDWRAVAEQARAEAAKAKADYGQAQAEAARWKGFARKHEDHLKGKNETIRTQEAFFRLVADKLEIPYEDTPDPEQLSRSLVERTEQNRDLLVERAIYLGAANEGANAAALLDSREFLAKAAQVDPDSAAFADLVRDLVREAAKDDRYKLAPAKTLTPQDIVPPAQLQPAAQFQQPPAQPQPPVQQAPAQPAPQQQPPAPASGADFSGAPDFGRLWTQADYDYWATGPGKARDRNGDIMSAAIEKGLLVNIGIGKPRRQSYRR